MLKDIEKLNVNLEDLVEVLRDFNTIVGRVMGYKVKYKENKKDKNEKDNA